MITIYMCYFIGMKNRIVGRSEFRAASDQEAITTARSLATEQTSHGFELWEGLRRVRAETGQWASSAAPLPASDPMPDGPD